MSTVVRLRSLNRAEEGKIRRLARSQTAPIRLVQRARIIAGMLEDPTLSATKAGLEDRPRSGRPRTHSDAVRSALIGLALQKPPSLGYPFKLWTLERLQRAFFEQEEVHLSDSTIWTWMEEEGFRWRKQESWFRDPEKHDPDFAERKPSGRGP